MIKYLLLAIVFFILHSSTYSQDKVKDLFNQSWSITDTVQKKLLREQIIKLSPDSEYGLFCKAWIYSLSNDGSQAIAFYTKSININSKFWQAYFNRGYTYFELEDYKKSLTDFKEIIKLFPDIKNLWSEAWNIYVFIGRCYYMLDDYKNSITYYSGAIDITNDKDNAVYLYLNRGYCYSEIKEYTKAAHDFTMVIDKMPDSFDAFYNRGIAYRNLKYYGDAIVDFNKAIELQPDNPDAYFYRGYTYQKSKQITEALNDYNKTIELDPNYSSAYNNRGNIYYDLGQYETAITDYKKALEIDPKDNSCKQNLKNAQNEISKLKYTLKYDFIEYSFGDSKFTFYSNGLVTNSDLNAKGKWTQSNSGITIELFSYRYMMNLYLMSYDCCLGELNSIKVFDPNDFSKQYVMKKLK